MKDDNNNFISLCIDTSTDCAIIGLYTDHKLIDVLSLVHANNLSKVLLPSIATLLTKHHLRPCDLRSIALGIGPGSYTGTRVGAAVAKSLGFALQIPLLPFPSPLAFIPPSVQGDFMVLMPSKAGPCFVLHGTLAPNALSQVDTFFLSPDELALHLQHSPRTVITPALKESLNNKVNHFSHFKAPGFDQKKGASINCNTSPFLLIEPRELSSGSNGSPYCLTTPNLPALLPFLSTVNPLRAEDVSLTYLHHPTPTK